MVIIMKEKYEKEYYLRISDFDCRGCLQPASVLDLFQDVAGAHANQLGIGLGGDTNLIWVLVKVQYQELLPVEMYSKVKVTTWPIKPTGIVFQRDYTIEDAEGNTVVKGTSEWVVVHSEKRKMVPVKDIYPLETFCEDRTFEGKLARLRPEESNGEVFEVVTGFSDIDVNGHVNNTKYANFVMNAIKPTEQTVIDIFRIDYHKEVLGGATLDLFVTRGENTAAVIGKSKDNEAMFTCSITFKGNN